jgi:outer membrane protein assembly factor BamB
MYMLRRLLFSVVGLSVIGHVMAGDWTQWRGPNRDGKSTDTGLLKSWPAGGPKLDWKSDDVGTGYGSPAVVGDRIYLIGGSTSKSDSKDSLYCVSAKDGTKLWSQEFGTAVGKYLDGWGGGPRATPTIDGEFLYVLGATGDFACMNTKDGKIAWSKNLVSDFGGSIPKWGYSESPLVDGDLVVVTPGKGSGMVAFDKKTGNVSWNCKDNKDEAGYSSIVIATVGGTKMYCQQSMKQAFGVDAKTGKQLWNAGQINRATAVIPTPVVMGSDIFYTAGYGAGSELIQLTGSGNSIKADVKYSTKALSNHHGGVIEHNGMIFGHGDKVGWMMFDPKEGKELWLEQGIGKGSVSFASGMFYCYSESKGECALVEPSNTEWKLISKFTIPETSKKRPGQGKIWPHPVIANGKLYLRDYEKLFVFNIGSSAE